MIEIFFEIPGAPITKKNSNKILLNPKTGKRFVATSDQYRRYEKSAEGHCPKVLVSVPVNCRYIYYMPTHRRVDLSNLISATNDVLVKHGTLMDDNRDVVVSHDGSCVLYDRERPRVEITITQKENYTQWKPL